MNGYIEALESACAEVHDHTYFGSYQGEWYALVTYRGKAGFVIGSYGSCSGCDAFQAEFGWDDGESSYQERLAEFGRRYLDDGMIYSFDEAIKYAGRHWWDQDAEQMVAWVKGAWEKHGG